MAHLLGAPTTAELLDELVESIACRDRRYAQPASVPPTPAERQATRQQIECMFGKDIWKGELPMQAKMMQWDSDDGYWSDEIDADAGHAVPYTPKRKAAVRAQVQHEVLRSLREYVEAHRNEENEAEMREMERIMREYTEKYAPQYDAALAEHARKQPFSASINAGAVRNDVIDAGRNAMRIVSAQC
jgi:hypothetical protein